ALRAMAIATGVVAVVDQPALPAADDVAAQRRRAAAGQVAQGPHHAGGGLGILLQERVPEATHEGTDRQLVGGGVGPTGGGVSRGLTARASPAVGTCV